MYNQAPGPPFTSLLVSPQGVSRDAEKSRFERIFFVAMAVLFPVLAGLGFAPSYQAAYSGQIKLHWFVHVHGALMTSWLLIFLVQSLLAAKGQLRFHRQLGLFSVTLGAIIWISMGMAVVRSLLEFPPPVDDRTWDTVTLSLAVMVLFGMFFTAGILLRRNSAAHKRLLLIATVVLMQAAVDRIQWLPGLGTAYFVRFIYVDALLLPLFVYDLVTVRRVHRMTGLACGLLLAMQLAVTLNAGSPAVHRFWFNRLAPFVEKVVEVKLTDTQTEPLLGNYGWEKWHLTIFRAGGKLYLKLPDQEPSELAATSETEFFTRKMFWHLTFQKNADGKVIKVINKEPRATWEAPKT